MIIPEEPRRVHQEKPGQKASNIMQQTCLTHVWRLAGFPLLNSVAFLGQAVLVLESSSPLPLGLAVFIGALGSLHAVCNMTPFGSITLASKLSHPNSEQKPQLRCRNNSLHGAVPDAIGFSRSWLGAGKSHPWTSTSVGGNFKRTFSTIGPYEFPQEKVWTNDWSI